MRQAIAWVDDMTADHSAAPMTPDGEARASGYAWYALGLMFVVYVLNFIDRQILSILAEDIKRDLALTDVDLGFLFGTAFAVFYGVFGIPIGRLVDEWRRGWLMAMGLALWSTMTALSGLATNYAQLAIGRIGVGIGEASASPAAYSLIADYFPKRQRAAALSIYSAALYVGIGLSLVFGARIATVWDGAYSVAEAPMGLKGWQAAFICVGLLGLPLAVVVSRLKEPVRGGMDGTPAPTVVPGAWRRFLAELVAVVPPLTLWSVSRIRGGLAVNLMLAGILAAAAILLVLVTGDTMQWAALALGIYSIGSWIQMLRDKDLPAYRLICTTPAMLLGLGGFGLLAMFGYTFSFWAPPFAMRELGVTKEVAGVYLGLPGAAASAAGVILGGMLSDAWRARDARGRIFVCILSLLLPPPFLWLALQQQDFATFAMIAPVIYFTSSLWVGSGVAAFQDLVLPRMRGLVGAITVLASTIVGLAIGPYLVGKISTVSGSLQTGLYALFCVAPLSLILLVMMSRKVGAAEASKVERAKAAGEA
jgi:MFS family permease